MFFYIINELIVRIYKPVIVENTNSTLDNIKNNKLSIARFGDGEFGLILGYDEGFQKSTKALSEAIKKVLVDSEHNDNCLIAIPYTMYKMNGFTLKSKFFWIKYFAKNRKFILPYLNSDYKYFDSQISRIYINRANKDVSKIYFSKWQSIWKDQKILLVEGEKSRFGVGNSLLSTAQRVRRILCPSTNAYEKYDEIYDTILRSFSGNDLVLISLGPTATLLAYQLSKAGIWVIDTGNMDIEYEWMLRGTKTKVAVGTKYTYEAIEGTCVTTCNDAAYNSQIIKKIL